MSGRFPGARTVEELWETLANGREAITEIPAERFAWGELYEPQRSERPPAAAVDATITSKWLAVLPGIEEFDSAFFEISPKEARSMDPRQRLLLHEAFSALEDAGYAGAPWSTRRIGVFVGVEQGDQRTALAEAGMEDSVTGTHDGVLAARLSYFLDLQGPAMAINTACSSGLVAAHQACLSLRAGECEAAIAAAANVILSPASYVAMSRAGMLSPDGRCYAFDRRANGMVPGEAVAAVVLKRLSRAQADRDAIHAVIRGSGINYDGRTNGLTAPGGAAQADLITEVMRRAQTGPRAIEYIVAHGTGTRLGDPVEVQALSEAFREAQGGASFCALTSTKGNVGHTFAASGLVSLIGLVQAMRHETIPPSLHCEQLSDYVDWSRSPFFVNTHGKPWPKRLNEPRVGAVSAFGMSGTNAHMILESYRERTAASDAPTAPFHLIAFSAKTEVALQQRARDLLEFMSDERRGWDARALASLSDTLLVYRRHFAHRCAFVSADRTQTVARLAVVVSGASSPLIFTGTVPRGFAAQPTTYDHGQRLLGQLIGKRADPQRYVESLTSLAELYCQGYLLDWRDLHRGERTARMQLPAYPLARERYPLPTAGRPAAKTAPPTTPRLHAPPRALRPLTEIAALAPRTEDRSAASEEPAAVQKPEARSGLDRSASAARSRTEQAEAVDRLEEDLATSLAAALYMDVKDIDRTKPFVEIGLDSIVGVEWVRALNARYGLSLTATKIYDFPTISALAALIARERAPGTATAPRPMPRTLSTLMRPADSADPPTATTPSGAAEQGREAAGRGVFGAAGDVSSPEGAAIAIIGAAGRYPRAPDLREFWRKLAGGEDCVEEIPPSRWNVSEFYDRRPRQPDKCYCKWLGRIDDVESFDPLFFNISPAEAQRMDPQQRLFLQESYRALEDAGCNPRRLSNARCGVYLGVAGNEYASVIERCGARGDTTGNNSAIAAARIAYHLNLKGPAIAIDTACSASLVATHLACQALRSREIEMALAGGVTLYLTPQSYIAMCSAGMLSERGRCRAFDNRADGFVPGEGVGVLVLKRLSDARRSDDRIYGVIIGSGTNQDGKTNGITAPSASSQMELVRDIYARYGIDPQSINYVEMHGTGTKLGDPIELEALCTVFRERTEQNGYCALGSVKSNIG
ncbi:MAG: beta-ketoacyl synthase N-terminal-like domain-containing protein, partial [Steroidobacteraceae bacterium]